MAKLGLAICWLRNDLRIQDNPALTYALQHHQQTLCVYLDDAVAGDDPPAADIWRYAAIQDLAQQLQGRLLYQTGQAWQNLQALVKQYQAVAVYWNRLYDPQSIARDRQIKADLQTQGITVRSFAGSLLYEPWQTIKADGQPYRVFTPFYKACLAQGLPLPEAESSFDFNRCYPVVFNQQHLPSVKPAWSDNVSSHWLISRAGAEVQLQQFVADGLSVYATGRDFPAQAGVSRLAPYLHSGQLGPREVVAAAMGSFAADAFIRQLIWRDFAHAVLYHWPDTLGQSMDKRFVNFPWQDKPAALRAWQHGQTGIPIVDAGMRQLWQTGYMHNRVRMLVASFLCKHLLIDWRQGAAWFMDTLFDADLANNTMGWQWVAGCGVDAAPYFRVFNPVTQGEKFDPAGDYVRCWVPELKALPNQWIHQPWCASANVLAQAGIKPGQYPEPIVDLAAGRKRALEVWQSIK